ncbi:M28 family peptidase [Pseudonocardia nematodicida]|uniref:M28 family peptidase n=1 Tax=Pseudonocardia nematodicida TaxID=1206997 RepID=A0ABV1K3Z7_9PSEU
MNTARVTGVAGLLLVLAVAVWSLVDIRPPAPAGADAPAGEFSAERAMRHVEAIAREPRPMGSDAHDRARQYLVTELTAMGIAPEVRDAVGVRPYPADAATPVGRVRNVVGVADGSDPTAPLVLAAHYDSTPTSPGANDDAVGVAVALETARALLARDAPRRNDLVVLLTDGEEMGLLGAEAFAHDDPLAVDGGVVLNHEARGAGGPVIMFRGSAGSSDLVRTYGAAAPSPVADSATAGVFEFLPNDTDFVAFERGGLSVLDFAYVQDSAYYHSALDLPENVDPRSVQHMGETTLATAAELAGRDLAAAGGDEDLAYVNVPPGTLVVVPAWVLSVLAVLGGGLTVVAVLRARRRGAVRVRRVLLGAGAGLLLVVASVAAAWAYWQLLVTVHPAFGALPTATPYRPVAFHAGVVLLVATLCAVWFGLLRRRAGADALRLGGLVLVALLAVLTGLTGPASSVMFVVPLVAAAAAAATLPGPLSGRPTDLVTVVALLPVGLLALTAGWVALDIGTGTGGLAAAPSLTLGFLLLLPLVEAVWPPPGRARWVPLVLVVALGGTTAAGLVVNTVDATRPVPVRLAYTLDADTGEASWSSPFSSGTAHAWTRGYVGEPGRDPAPGANRPDPVAPVGPARPAALAAPELTVLDDADDGELRTVRLRLTSERGARSLSFVVDGDPNRVRGLVVAGRDLGPGGAGHAVGARFHVLPADGAVEVTIVVDSDDGPLGLRVSDIDSEPGDLAGLPGYTPPPDDAYLQHAQVAVTRAYEL